MKQHILVSAVLSTLFFTMTGNAAPYRLQPQAAQPVNAHAITGVTSVKAAQVAQDNTPAEIRGKIVRALGDEKYELQDNTGKIRVEIDNELAQLAQLVGKNVTVIGEVDVKKGGRRDIDADYLQIH